MRRVLLHWRGTAIYSYPAMLYVGLLAATATGNWAAHASGLNAFRVYVAMIVLMVPAIAGARLLHVVIHWRSYSRNVRRIWDRSEGRYSMYGGLPLALLFSVPLLYIFHLLFAAFWDVGALSPLPIRSALPPQLCRGVRPDQLSIRTTHCRKTSLACS